MLPSCEPQQAIEFKFEGRMDTARCAKIEGDLRAALHGAVAPVVFDLEGVEFVSSGFLRLCVYAYQQAGGRGFRVVHAAPTVKRVFKIAGLDVMLQEE